MFSLGKIQLLSLLLQLQILFELVTFSEAFVFILPSPGGGDGEVSGWYLILVIFLMVLSVLSCISWCCWCQGRNLCGATPVRLMRNPASYPNPSQVYVKKPDGRQVVYNVQQVPAHGFVPGSSYAYYGPQPGTSQVHTPQHQSYQQNTKVFKS